MQVTATETGRYTVPSQVVDENLTSSYKWFSLQANVLDGSYHPIPADGSSQIGWWGTSLSDSSGYLSTSPTLTITFDGTRPVHTLRVAGDPLLDEYPVNFVVKLYNGSTLLYTETVTGNSQVVWKKALQKTYDATQLELTVARINKAGRTVKILDALNPFEIYRTDALSQTVGYTEQVSLLLSSSDALSTVMDTSRTVTASIPSRDNLAVAAAGSSFFRQYEFKRSDALKTLAADKSYPATVSLSVRDDLKAKIEESIPDFVVQLAREAELLISPDIEATEVTVELPLRTDRVGVTLADNGSLTNIHTLMNALKRRIYGRVQITYSAPFLDASITATASGTAYGTDPYGTANSLDSSAYKWFSLHENRLDGSYHPMPTEPKVGWWSNVLSDDTGSFAEPPSLILSFEPRSVYELRVVGDDKLNNYPVDFAINLHDADGTLLYSEQVTGNDKVIWLKSIDLVANVAKMELIIHRINQPYSTAKIVEFFTMVQETYEGSDLLSINLLEEQESSNGTLPIGNISSNEIRIRLNNEDRHFDPSNVLSPIHNRLKKNRRIRAWLGAEVVPGEIEWYSLGEFWTLDWHVPELDYYAETTGRDRLELMRQTEFTASEVYKNRSLYALAEIILQDYGLTADQYIVDPALQDIVIPYAWFDRITHREALQKVATAALARVYTDREGRVVIRVFEPTADPIFEFENSNIFDKDQPLAWEDTINHVEVKSIPLQPGELEVMVQDTEGFTVPAGSEVEQTYSFSTSPVVDVRQPEIETDGDVNIKEYTAYAWGIRIVVQNTGDSDAKVNSVVVQGRKLEQSGGKIAVARDELSIKEHGVQKLTIENEFIQTVERAQAIANGILSVLKDPRHDLSLDARGNIALQLSDRVRAWGEEYFIVRQELDWAGSLSAKIKARKVGDA